MKVLPVNIISCMEPEPCFFPALAPAKKCQRAGSGKKVPKSRLRLRLHNAAGHDYRHSDCPYINLPVPYLSINSLFRDAIASLSSTFWWPHSQHLLLESLLLLQGRLQLQLWLRSPVGSNIWQPLPWSSPPGNSCLFPVAVAVRDYHPGLSFQ